MFFSQAWQVDCKIHLEVETSKNNQKNPGRKGLGGKLSLSDTKKYYQTFVNIKCSMGARTDRQISETEEQRNGHNDNRKFSIWWRWLLKSVEKRSIPHSLPSPARVLAHFCFHQQLRKSDRSRGQDKSHLQAREPDPEEQGKWWGSFMCRTVKKNWYRGKGKKWRGKE